MGTGVGVRGAFTSDVEKMVIGVSQLLYSSIRLFFCSINLFSRSCIPPFIR